MADIAMTLLLLTTYLFLVAQFESLRDPVVVLVTVPMSLCGALIFLALDFASLSLFSQVGLISKHGISSCRWCIPLLRSGGRVA